MHLKTEDKSNNSVSWKITDSQSSLLLERKAHWWQITATGSMDVFLQPGNLSIYSDVVLHNGLIIFMEPQVLRTSWNHHYFLQGIYISLKGAG